MAFVIAIKHQPFTHVDFRPGNPERRHRTAIWLRLDHTHISFDLAEAKAAHAQLGEAIAAWEAHDSAVAAAPAEGGAR